MHLQSAHLVSQKGIIPIHVIHRRHQHNLELKSEHQFSNSMFGNYVVQFLSKPSNCYKNLKFTVKVRRNDGCETSDYKICKDTLQSGKKESENNLASGNFSVSSSISNSFVDEVSEHKYMSKEHISANTFDYQSYLSKLKALLLHVLASGQWNNSRLKMCHRIYKVSATNLIHYLALHSLDDQQLKERLSSIGLLNLETSNAHILASITAGIQLLERKALYSYYEREMLYYISEENINMEEFSINSMRMKALANASSLLGTSKTRKDVQIMVTVGKEAIANENLLSDLLKAGANVIRVNCAHDDCSTWSEIIQNAKQTSQILEIPCKIIMDLAGPKLRTGLMNKGPDVMKIAPKKDVKGNTIIAAQIWLSSSGCRPPPHISPDALLYVDNKQFLNKLEAGNTIKFVDVRGRKRSLKVGKRYSVFSGYGYMVECTGTAYVESGTQLKMEKKKGKDSVGTVVNVPASEPFIRLKAGDLLTISKGHNSNNALGNYTVTCDCSRLFDCVKPGDPIAFDDGKIWGVIKGASDKEIVVSITHASLKGSKLGSEKSINVPESKIQFEGLTSKDLQDLDFVAGNANMVGVSFVRDVKDVDIVMKELARRKLNDLGVVLKIETRDGFEKLPLLLLQAMQYSNPIGVMIARGDLAVECGWNKMAGIQEDILSICSAAHIPVIWATQVLESLVKSGIPSRAEITDVASGMRASCIMLNKGKYIVEAVSSLKTILRNQSTKESVKTVLKPFLPSS